MATDSLGRLRTQLYTKLWLAKAKLAVKQIILFFVTAILESITNPRKGDPSDVHRCTGHSQTFMYLFLEARECTYTGNAAKYVKVFNGQSYELLAGATH